MSRRLHTPPNESKAVYKWYRKAQIDYIELYIHMYIAYNTWYRQVTSTTNDREAIGILKKRFIIWDDYYKGRTMQNLKVYTIRLSKLTKEKPLMHNARWEGVINDEYDWRNLIEFWYQIRCLVVHGSDVPPKYVWLAYETLDIFMAEIIERMQACFTDKDLQRLEEVSTLAQNTHAPENRFKLLQRKLQAKYIESPDIWQVDMQRVQ